MRSGVYFFGTISHMYYCIEEVQYIVRTKQLIFIFVETIENVCKSVDLISYV